MAGGAAGFDYVIVGAGSAGCTLANRLSEEPGCRVLLLEAGGWDRDWLIHVPLGWGKILQKRLHDWMYFSEPQAEVDGRRVECARGKVVGGSSSTNAMAYVRGNRRDFDLWAEQGLPQWSHAHALPYFRKLETWGGGANAWRGGEGPMNAQFCRYQDSLLDGFAEAGLGCGYGWTDDYNAQTQDGFGRLQMTIRDGRRCSTATAYLRPAMRRGGVEVRVRAQATRILFEGRRAVGIEYSQDGKLVEVRAEREVILAGGVINSPQLLMLSGIGAPDELARHDIKTRAALPGVGKNLQDHVSVILMYDRKEPGPFFRRMRYDRVAGDMARAYLLGKGPAADVPGGITAFLRSREGLDRPDLHFLFTAAPLGAWPYLRPFKAPFTDGFACRLVALHPESRGTVELANADPLSLAVIRQNFLSTDNDWRVLRRGVEIAREIAAQPAMRGFIAREKAPGGAAASNEAVDAYIRKTAITVHHPLGTCRMGPDGDPLAVVDPELRVRGVEGLRVVDGSVMPELTSGNINAPIIMIAERAADLIRGKAPLAPESPLPA